MAGTEFEKVCFPSLIGLTPTEGCIDVDTGGWGVGCNLPLDRDVVMEDDGLLFVDGSEA